MREPNPGEGATTTAAPIEVQCRECGSTVTMPAHRFAAVCPFCASGSVVERSVEEGAELGSGRVFAPEYAVGFAIPRARAEGLVSEWLKRGRLFAPGELKHAEVSRVEGIYLPAWLYSAEARSRYQAQIGENYTETETYTTTDSKGRTVTRTRTVVKTEWRDLSGDHVTYVADHLVTACRGLSNAELEALEPYDLGAIRRYDPAIVAGFAGEEATRTEEEGHEIGRKEAMAQLEREVEGFLPGDSRRLTHLSTDFVNEDTDLLLLPVWIFAARWGKERKLLRVLVNGQTGEVQGKVPTSALRVTVAVLVVLALLAGVALIGGGLAR